MTNIIAFILKIIFYITASILALPISIIRISWAFSSVLLENLYGLNFDEDE